MTLECGKLQALTVPLITFHGTLNEHHEMIEKRKNSAKENCTVTSPIERQLSVVATQLSILIHFIWKYFTKLQYQQHFELLQRKKTIHSTHNTDIKTTFSLVITLCDQGPEFKQKLSHRLFTDGTLKSKMHTVPMG